MEIHCELRCSSELTTIFTIRYTDSCIYFTGGTLCKYISYWGLQTIVYSIVRTFFIFPTEMI